LSPSDVASSRSKAQPQQEHIDYSSIDCRGPLDGYRPLHSTCIAFMGPLLQMSLVCRPVFPAPNSSRLSSSCGRAKSLCGSVAEQSPILSTRRSESVVELKKLEKKKKNTKLLNGPTPLSIGRENDVAIAHFCIVQYCPCVRKLPLNIFAYII
jgi:hypothetical protein